MLIALALLFGLGVLPAGCSPSHGTIGAVLGQKNDGRLYVRETPPGLAADKAGLKPGDEILLIDGRDVRTLDERTLHRVLSGDVGSKVKLTAIRGERVLRVELVRTAAKRLPGAMTNPGNP